MSPNYDIARPAPFRRSSAKVSMTCIVEPIAEVDEEEMEEEMEVPVIAPSCATEVTVAPLCIAEPVTDASDTALPDNSVAVDADNATRVPHHEMMNDLTSDGHKICAEAPLPAINAVEPPTATTVTADSTDGSDATLVTLVADADTVSTAECVSAEKDVDASNHHHHQTQVAVAESSPEAPARRWNWTRAPRRVVSKCEEFVSSARRRSSNFFTSTRLSAADSAVTVVDKVDDIGAPHHAESGATALPNNTGATGAPTATQAQDSTETSRPWAVRVARRFSNTIAAAKEGMRRRSSDSFTSQSTRTINAADVAAAHHSTANTTDTTTDISHNDKHAAVMDDTTAVRGQVKVSYRLGVRDQGKRLLPHGGNNRQYAISDTHLTVYRKKAPHAPKFRLKLENCTVRDSGKDATVLQLVSNVVPPALAASKLGRDAQQGSKRGICIDFHCGSPSVRDELRASLMEATNTAFYHMIANAY